MTEPLPRSGGTVFIQVLVAALFLAVIGGSVGLALGLQERDRGGDQGNGGRRSSATEGGGATEVGGTTRTTEPGSGNPSSTPCPDRTRQQVGRDLKQMLYIQTANSEVWICRDGGGALYYQGHRFSDETWLFLSDVEQNGDEYVATNPSAEGTTYYRVSRKKLVIENAGGNPEEQPVVGPSG